MFHYTFIKFLYDIRIISFGSEHSGIRLTVLFGYFVIRIVWLEKNKAVIKEQVSKFSIMLEHAILTKLHYTIPRN